MLGKTYIIVLVIFWIRGTFPRLRIDQLMALGWKALVPISFLVVLFNGFYLFYHLPAWSLTLVNLVVLAGLFGYLYRRAQQAPQPPAILRYSARELRRAR